MRRSRAIQKWKPCVFLTYKSKAVAVFVYFLVYFLAKIKSNFKGLKTYWLRVRVRVRGRVRVRVRCGVRFRKKSEGVRSVVFIPTPIPNPNPNPKDIYLTLT